MSLDDAIKRKLGTERPAFTTTTGSVWSSRLVPMRSADDDQVDAKFDARRRWPRRMRLPEDQKECAASWLYSAAGPFLATVSHV